MSIKNTTTITQRKVLRGEGAEISTASPTNGFSDNTASSPRQVAANAVPLARGGSNLDLSGGELPEGIVLGDVDDLETSYVHQTPSGHVIEYNDTPFSERILIKHGNGTGINIGPDGSVIISSKAKIDIINGDHHVTVGGDGSLTYKGSLTLKVEGDFNLDVGGDYNVSATNYTHTNNGAEKKTTYGDQANIVLGNKSEVINGAESQTIKSGSSKFVKGDTIFAVEGLLTMGASGVISFTSEEKLSQSSPDINIAATNLSVFGASGTIGGEGVIGYVKNIYGTSGTFTAGVTAPTFHGDLKGTAETAATSVHQSYADGTGTGYSASVGTQGSITEVATNTTATTKPTSALLSSYLDKGSNGVRKIVVDPGNIITDSINLSTKTGGITNKPLGVDDVRAALRDPSNRANSEFISSQIASGNLSPEFAKTTPPSVTRVRDASATNVRGGTPLGNVPPAHLLKRSKGL